jgi:hypothetical protein
MSLFFSRRPHRFAGRPLCPSALPTALLRENMKSAPILLRVPLARTNHPPHHIHHRHPANFIRPSRLENGAFPPHAATLSSFEYNLQMQQPSPVADTARPVFKPATIKVAVRSSVGHGSRVVIVEAPADGTVADVKRLLCLAPQSMCSDALALELVMKGGVAAARTAD